MAHRALTLKYRPQVFADMVGQDHVSAVLTRAIEGGRIAHAYLFTGARGVGKTTCARIVAKSLNCIERAAGTWKGPDPCNRCPSCLEITNGTALDVIEIDGASNRGIADVQALREKVRFSPTGGRYRVVIIDEVHQLSNDAFAALLKTLEEPPAHLVFVFATTDPQKLPDTIRSRCQRFDFARVPLKRVADRLTDIAAREAKDQEGVRFTLTEGAAYLLAHKSEGSMRDAVSALDQVVSSGEEKVDEELVRRVLGLADREVFFGLAGAIVARDPKAALRALHDGFDKGLDARDLAEGLSEHVRAILLLKVDPDGGDLVAASREDIARLKAQGEGWSQDDLLRLLKIASEVGGPMRDSPQPLIHLEAAVVQMATLEPGESLAELLARLEALEQRLGGGPATPAAGGGRTASAPSRGAPGGVRAMGAGPAPAAAPMPPRAAPPGPAAAPRPASPPARFDAGAGRRETGGPAAALAEMTIVRDTLTDACWRETLSGLNRRKRMLGAFLEESRFLGLCDERLVVAMDDLHRAVVEEKENRALLIEAAGTAFGRVLGLSCVPLSAAPPPEAPAGATDVGPMIDRAIAYFEADIVPPKADSRGERTDG